MSDKKKLVFIFNADIGIVNSVKDFFKKILKPRDYECNLCMISYGNFGIKKEWKTFIKELNIATEFLHRDEFVKKYNREEVEFPSAYLFNGSNLTPFISVDEMNSFQTLQELMGAVNKKLEDVGA